MKITKTMTIGEILNLDNNCAPIFMNSGMHCLGCPASQGETIEEACAVHGLDCGDLINQLNEYFGDK